MTVVSGCVSPAAETTDTQAVTITDTDTESETAAETEEIKQDEEMKRYFIFRIWNFRLRGTAEFRSIVDTVANTGFNAIKIHMPWHLMQDENGNIDYSPFDEMLDYVINVKGLPVAVSRLVSESVSLNRVKRAWDSHSSRMTRYSVI